MKLGLIFTFGISVEIWHKQGLLDREKLLYEKFLEKGKFERIYWFTYGVSDKQYERRINPGIAIIEMPKLFNFRLGKLIYSFIMPILKLKYIKECDAIKTNQIKGSWTAWIAALLYRKRFVLRGGYLWSRFVMEQYGSLYSFFVSRVEGLMCRFAHAVIMSSKFQVVYIIKKYKLKKNKVFLVSNYVDIVRFRPKNNIPKLCERLVFVGRIHKQKNLENLVSAMKGLPLGLDIYGDGDLKGKLKQLVRQNAVDVKFKGFISNTLLPEVFQKYMYFILPSLYEGMPKALLEAMACGLVVIGTNVEGIREIIRHGENGWLIENSSVEKIRERLSSLGKYKELENKMAIQARKYIEENFSFKRIAERELNILNNIC